MGRPSLTTRVPTKRIYQYGPNFVRDSRDLRAALAILADRGRAWLEESGRRRSVVINPAPLTELDWSVDHRISTSEGVDTVATLATFAWRER
jgi:hypothetical protein